MVVDARERFLTALAGVTDPEKKRKIIGGRFIDVFEHEAKSIPGALSGAGLYWRIDQCWKGGHWR